MQNLAPRCLELSQAVNQALAWAGDNSNIVKNEAAGLTIELRRAGRLFRQCAVAAQRKMCVGVFGPSQSGKSYLISALARDAKGLLLAEFGGITHDFISEINPEGGKESTGLVTRFTMTKQEVPSGFPVKIRLLSEMDLVKIIANTYYADCEHKDVPDAKAINRSLEQLEGLSGDSLVSLDDMEDLQEYLLRDFKAKPRVQELERCYFMRAAELGPKLSLAGRIKLYSLIWDEVPEFTGLLEILLNALQELDYAQEAYAQIEALIPRDGSIIDVAMLKGLGQEQKKLELMASGKQVSLPRAIVAALTAELTIAMRNKPDDYFEHTDLLDFPGYRSRYKIDNIRNELQKPDMLKEMFLRGKVAYLFQRYCAERELTSMLLCIGPSNQEVQDLPGVINDWILATHGETPERRQGKAKALYFVLTKFDMEFEQKKGAPSVETRWDNRLHASLLDFFGKQHDWPKIWDGQGAFNNLFLLRNPNFRFDAVLEYDAAGQELKIRPDQQAYVNSLQKAFFNSPIVAQHFERPQEAWEAAMRLNDGGISYIRQKLRPLCNPEIKNQQILTTLEEKQERLLARLSQFWKTDNKAEERKQKDLLGRELAQIFAKMAQNQQFGDFLRLLGTQDHDLYELYFEAERRMRHNADEEGIKKPVVVGTSINSNDILDDLFGNTGELFNPTIEDLTQEKRFKDEAEYFSELIESHWLEKLHTLSDNVVLQQHYELPGKYFSSFVAELSLGARRLGLREQIEVELRQASRYANIDLDRVIWKQVSLATNILNSYLNWLGFSNRTQTKADRTIHILGRTSTLFEPPAKVDDYPELPEEQGAYDKAYYLDWLRACIYLITANVDFDGQSTINISENARLGKIIQTIKGEPNFAS